MTVSRVLIRRAALVAATATTTVVLAACGGDGGGDRSGNGSASSSTGTGASTGAHNTQDVSFAQGMIPHHQQAVEMAGLAAGRASSAQVKDLASRIEKAQDPEITTMTGWLRSWGEDVPASDDTMGSMPGMDHSGHSGMPGMMTAQDMDRLKKASGKDFDTMFLTMMVEHHKGAIEMATTEKDKGTYGPATSLAGGIVSAQTAEITEMDKLLGKG